jgi:hypothetical protein
MPTINVLLRIFFSKVEMKRANQNRIPTFKNVIRLIKNFGMSGKLNY